MFASPRLNQQFAPLTAAVLTIIIVLYAVGVRYGNTTGEVNPSDASLPSSSNQVNHYYGMFIHVSIMIFIGFGYLMTFLKRYGYSALGYNFLLSAIAFLWDILCAGFWINVHSRASNYTIRLDFPLLLEGLFGAGTVMISFGAVIGRVTVSQLVLMTFLEIIGYSFNLYLGIRVLKAIDAGGSMIIHTFGAYFGLAVSWTLHYLRRREAKGRQLESSTALGATTTSDITAMIGTIFLWIMWPSFNAVMSSPDGRLRAIANTFLSLCASVIATFILSILTSHKFDMVHVQNSTLAGGVAMGAAADLYLEPGGALGIGAFAGIVSVLGYKYLTPFLERTIGLYDTCGVHNLHGMPGVIGGVSTIIVAAASGFTHYGAEAGTVSSLEFNGRGNQGQAHYQVYVLLHTLGIALVYGVIVGSVLHFTLPGLSGKDHYEDSSSWEVQSDYNPNDFTSPKSVEIKMVTSGNTNAAGNARSVQTENGGVTYLNAQPTVV